MQKKTGILLAGGLSRRYGAPKAFAKVHGTYFYEQMYAILEATCDHVVIVTREEFINWFPENYHVIVDVEAYQGCGPLAGIYSGMDASIADAYIVLPCDMPLLRKDIIQKLYEKHQSDVTIVEVEGKLQPLVSVWNHEMMVPIQTSLDQGQYKMKTTLDRCHMAKVQDHQLTNNASAFLNINTSEEDREMREWLKS